MASSPPHVWPPAGTAGGFVPPVGPTFNGGLDVVVNTDGRAEAFFFAPFDANRSYLYFTWQNAPGAANWNKSYQLLSQQVALGNVRAIVPKHGKLTTFSFGPHGLYQAHQQSPHSGPWTDLLQGAGPSSTHNSFSNLAVPVAYHDDTIALFYAKAGSVGVVAENSPGAHAFTGPYEIFAHPGHNYVAFDVGRNKDDRFEVFMVDAADGSVWHAWQTGRALHPNLGWHAPERLGGLTGAKSLSVISNQDGRLEVFVVTSAKVLSHIWQTAPNSGWSNWDNIATGVSGDVDSIRGDGERVAVFTITDKGLGYWYQDHANAGPWHGPVVIGPSNVTHFRPFRNQNGLLEVIAVENARFAFHSSQNQPVLSAGWNGLQPIWPASGNAPG